MNFDIVVEFKIRKYKAGILTVEIKFYYASLGFVLVCDHYDIVLFHIDSVSGAFIFIN